MQVLPVTDKVVLTGQTQLPLTIVKVVSGHEQALLFKVKLTLRIIDMYLLLSRPDS
jgi:hypothetical protein